MSVWSLVIEGDVRKKMMVLARV